MLVAREIMTTKIITVTPETAVSELAQILATSNIGGAPVVDEEGRLLGVVTESDLIDQTKKVHIPTVVAILDSLIFLERPDKMEKDIRKIAGTVVGDIYSKNPVTVSEETPLDEIATIMAKKHVHTLPVLRGEQLVGVIGKGDIIRTLIP
jgi:CBS-domain-containing membrane protein